MGVSASFETNIADQSSDDPAASAKAHQESDAMVWAEMEAE